MGGGRLRGTEPEPGGPRLLHSHSASHPGPPAGVSGLTQGAQAWGRALRPSHTWPPEPRSGSCADTQGQTCGSGCGRGWGAAPARAMTHAAGAEKGTEKVSGGRCSGALREGERKVLTVSARFLSPGRQRRPHTSQGSLRGHRFLPSAACTFFFISMNSYSFNIL